LFVQQYGLSEGGGLSEHPSREELWAVCQGGLSPKRNRAVLLHLLAPCRRCLAEVLSAPSPISGLALRIPELTPARVAAYDDAVDRAISEAVRHEIHLQKQEAQARKALAVLKEGGLKAIQSLPRRLGGLARMKAFLARSWQLRHEDPAAMVDLAWFAAQISKTLNPRRYGAVRVYDFQTQAFAELGNAYRVADRLHEAGEALGRARQLFELGTREEILEIRLLELEASLAADRRQFGRAVTDLLKVLKYYRRTRDLHLAGRTLVKMGLYAGYAGDFEKGAELLEKGLAQVDSEREPELACAAAHNLILFLVDDGQFLEAKKLRLVHSVHLVNPQGRINEIKFRALEGRIDLGLGKYARAEAIFREVIGGFDEVGLPIVAGIERLDLTATLLAQGKAGEAKELALTTAGIFTSLEIQREAFQAVILLRNAFEMQNATREMVEEVASFLRRIELDPALRFEGRAWENPDRF
jgi:tetratricopeptide (TPR) repeat protein